MIIKSQPSDFKVREIIDYDIMEGGKYVLCSVQRRGIDHFGMLASLSSYFRVRERMIGYAGIKDKNAIITQHITLPYSCHGKLNNSNTIIDNDDEQLSICRIGRVEGPLTLGSVKANEFDIIIRDIDHDEKGRIDKSLLRHDDYVFPNYFGSQRFGSSNNNIMIGYHIVKKEFGKAAELLGIEDGKNSLERLIGLPRRMRMLMISALQSAIFNAALRNEMLGDGITELLADDPIGILVGMSGKRHYPKEFSGIDIHGAIPIAGLGMQEHGYTRRIMSLVGIDERDFAVRQMPDIILEPTSRKMFNRTVVSYEWIDDETISLSFTLPKGAYATILVESLAS